MDTLAGLHVSRETLEKLRIYQRLLEKWNPRINLVAPSTLANAWERHFEDSAQLLFRLRALPSLWGDLGSGGGFPGMVLAILGREMAPDCGFVLVESDQRKTTFLQTVSRETETPVRILAERIEQAAPLGAGVVTARALAPLNRLLPLIQRHMSPEATILLPKGRNYQQELDEVRDNFAFSLEVLPSYVDADSVILKIENLRNV